MAEKMSALYKFCQDKGGIEARMRLAVVSGISSFAAKDDPDTPENIQKLSAAIQEITGQQAPNV